MKTIAVIANAKSFADHIKGNLNVYLGSKAKIRSYSVRELESIPVLREDLILLSANTIFLEVIPKISEDSVVMNYDQTLSTDNAEALREAYDAEPFDRAYLVNIDYRLCTNVIRELYDAGFQHIEFIPFSGNSDEADPSVRVAVTPDEVKLVPPGIERIINIGQRVVNSECVVEICDKLGFDPNEVMSSEDAKKALDHISDRSKAFKPATGLRTDKGRRVYSGSHDARFHFRNIIGSSEIMKSKIEIAKRMAAVDASVLITGESGTGKEVFAQSIHNSSGRKDYNFVAINCAAIPENLFESELFGYDEGAFSGARKNGKAGYFELAHKGTLFLDEIGEMPLLLQGKLLRAIEERRIARVGSSKLIDVDVRIIAATNQDLEELVLEKKFRSDLYFRLNVLPLTIPPLRDRKEDILEVMYYLRDMDGGEWELEKDAEAFLKEYPWPGNIRELRNVVQYLDSLGLSSIRRADLPPLIGERIIEKKPEIIAVPTVKRDISDQEFRDFILMEGKNLELMEMVLTVMEAAEKAGTKAGRAQITDRIRSMGGNYTETEVRTAMRKLSETGFIRSDRGRGGSKLMDKGKRLLEEIKGVKGS